MYSSFLCPSQVDGWTHRREINVSKKISGPPVCNSAEVKDVFVQLVPSSVFPRLLNLIKKSEELLEQCKCEIQEFKLKHRKLRYVCVNVHELLHEETVQSKNIPRFTL